MADLLPDPPAHPGAPWRRSWHRYSDYRLVHEASQEAIAREGILVQDTLHFEEVIDRGRVIAVGLRGECRTASGASMEIEKLLLVEYRDNAPWVRTREYRYHARIPPHVPGIFRYDNCHIDRPLHRHFFDVEGSDRGFLNIDPDLMPPLSIAVREAEWLAGWMRASGHLPG